FAVGPDDPATHKPRVYFLYHNLASGEAQHEMWVATSTDGGASFGVPVPIAPPGSDAYFDLQCADSGGPSAIWVNQRNGTIYPEGPLGRQYPDYSGAGVRYRWAPPAADGNFKWSAPKTLVPANKNAAGNVLVHMQAGDPGRLIAEYWRGVKRPGKEPVWFMTA